VKNITALMILGLFLASCAPVSTATPGTTDTPAVSTDTPVPPSNTPPAGPTNTPLPAATTPAPGTTAKHVFVVVMENHGYDQVWNTSSSPYITSLGNSYARATNYHALTHPSLPNYLQLYSGDNYNITNDCSPSASCHVNVTSLADNLEARGLTWKGYMESMPSPCYLKPAGDYAPKHNPFVYFDDIRKDANRCNIDVVPYTALAGDLASATTTPNFAFISPNLCNDMHDCPVSTGDTWLQDNLPAILNSPACTSDQCLLILTWDEDDSGGNNQVLTIFAGSMAKTGGVASAVSYTHYSTLRTIEDIFGLPTQTANDAVAAPMTDMLK
jgi:phosphatidylinositol-3-phosphatase